MLSDQEAAPERQFAGRPGKGFTGDCFRAAGEFDNHVAWLDDGNPFLRRALSFTHTGFQGLLADGLVREDSQPNLTAALHVPGGRHTGRLDLLACHPAAFQDLKSVFAEIQFVIASRDSPAAASLNLSMFHAFGH